MLDNSGASSVNAPLNRLPKDLDYIPEDLKIRARVELSEDEKTIDQKLKLLRSLLKEEGNILSQDDDLFLLAFLRCKKFDVKKALSNVKGFYSSLGKRGHLFYGSNFDFVKKLMEENTYGFLPYRDKDGSIILFIRFTYWDPTIISAEEHLVCISLGLMQALRSPATQIAGVKLIVDLKDFNMSQFLHTTPSSVMFFISMAQDTCYSTSSASVPDLKDSFRRHVLDIPPDSLRLAVENIVLRLEHIIKMKGGGINTIPIRFQGLHIVNQNYPFSLIWAISKHLVPKKIYEKIHFHGEDLDSLHKFFDPCILTAELGGDLPAFDNTEWRQNMEESADYIRHVLSYGYKKHLKKYNKLT